MPHNSQPAPYDYDEESFGKVESMACIYLDDSWMALLDVEATYETCQLRRLIHPSHTLSLPTRLTTLIRLSVGGPHYVISLRQAGQYYAVTDAAEVESEANIHRLELKYQDAGN